MGRSQESFFKKEVLNNKEKKRKEKEKKKLARKENEKKSSLDDMIAYVDENGNITSTPPDPSKKSEVELEDIEIGVPKKESLEEDYPVRKGVVSFFNESKGYGFIKDLDNQNNYFVHINNMLDQVREGNKVTFEVGSGPKGPVAIMVRLDQ